MSFTQRLSRFIFWGTIVLIVLLPFHAFLRTWLQSLFTNTTADSVDYNARWIALWKEYLMAILFIGIGIKAVLEKKWPFTWLKIDYAILGFVGFTILYWAITGFTKQGLFGLRIDLALFAGYFLGRCLLGRAAARPYDSFITLIKAYLIPASVVIACGLVLYYLLPSDFLVHFGYSPYASSYVSFKPLPMYHGLGENLETLRLASTFAGPNQLGGYLLIILSLGLGMLLLTKRNENFRSLRAWLPWVMMVSGTWTLFLTYSRAAWLGFLVAVGIIMWAYSRMPIRRVIQVSLGGLGAIILLGLGLYVMTPDVFDTYVLHAGSTNMHWLRMTEGLEAIARHPWIGLGPGHAGAVSRQFAFDVHYLVSENWFMQIMQEFGILAGLYYALLLVGLLYYLVRGFFKETNPLIRSMMISTVAGFAGLLVMGEFLHIFEDSSLSYLMGILLGVMITKYWETFRITNTLKSAAIRVFGMHK